MDHDFIVRSPAKFGAFIKNVKCFVLTLNRVLDRNFRPFIHRSLPRLDREGDIAGSKSFDPHPRFQMLTLMLALQLAAPLAPSNPTVYHGRNNQTAVAVPKLADREIRIDGALTEAEWSQASILTGFSQFNPVDDRAAEDSTEILVWYTDHAMYVGVRAYETHGAVRATLADRDRIGSDDYVMLLLDTFHDKRRAMVFGANPFGVQLDGIIDETRSGDLDGSPDYLYSSKGRLTDFGYEVEVRIPFKSLRYPSTKQQDWGFNVLRRVQHSGQDQTWTAARRSAPSFIAQAGTLQQLTDLKRGLVLELNPVSTAKLEGRRLPQTVSGTTIPQQFIYDYGDFKPEFGGNVRWGVTPNLTMNGTINPDFSQVEADVAQINFDPRQALFFPEKRPFFLDAIEQFNVPNLLIYTRSIADPAAAVKFTGKVGNTNVGFLSAVDDTLFSRGREHNPLFNILRLRRDVGTGSTLGLVYTDKIDGDDYNRVAGIDGRFVFNRIYTFSGQVAGSFWRTADVTETVPTWEGLLSRSGRRFGFNFIVEGVHDDFVPGAGFVNRTGVVHQNFQPRFTWYGDREDRVQSYTLSFNFDNTWDYQEFEEGIGPDDIKFHINNNWRLRGGWNLGLNAFIETFRYPSQLYSNYYVEQLSPAGVPTDTVPFIGRRRIPNYDIMATVNTPQWSKFSANGFIVAGRDENFEEWAPGYILFGQWNVNYRPTDQLRVNFMYNEQRTIRPSDQSVVRLSRIPRLKVEYQVTRPLFLRVVGQYVADERDQLRDDARTGLPILICNATRTACNRGNRETQTFRGDVLLSYQPNPGTVLYAGYGSTQIDSNPFAFGRGSNNTFIRSSDGFFFKLSYLFRL